MSKHLSSKVCKNCHDNLFAFYDFKKKIVENQEKLNQLLKKTIAVKVEDLSDENEAAELFEPAIVIKTEDTEETSDFIFPSIIKELGKKTHGKSDGFDSVNEENVGNDLR